MRLFKVNRKKEQQIVDNNPGDFNTIHQNLGRPIKLKPSARIIYARHDPLNNSDCIAWLTYEVLLDSKKYKKVGFDHKDSIDYSDEDIYYEIKEKNCKVIIVLTIDSDNKVEVHRKFLRELEICAEAIIKEKKDRTMFIPFFVCEKKSDKNEIEYIKKKIMGDVREYTHSEEKGLEDLFDESKSYISINKPDNKNIFDPESKNIYKLSIAKEFKDKSLIDELPRFPISRWQLLWWQLFRINK